MSTKLDELVKAFHADGGPAFQQFHLDPWQKPHVSGGMSLRDWFAGQAIIGAGQWTPGPEVPSLNCQDALDRRAEWAYAQADAMLAQRAEPPR